LSTGSELGLALFALNEKHFTIRTQETLEIGCFEAQQPKIIIIFFIKLEAAWKKYNIRPEDCYNTDKNGVQIGVGGSKMWL
jgi:hypothetical protein